MLEVNKINVLHLRSSPFLGSPEKLLLGRIKTMDNSYCQYIVGVFDEQPGKANDFLTSLQELNCPTINLHTSMGRFYNNARNIYTAINRYGINIICTHDYKSNFYGLFIRLFLKVPIIAVFHGRIIADIKGTMYQKLDDFLLRFFDSIICVSEHTEKNIRRSNITSKNLFVIPNAVDTEQIEHASDSKPVFEFKKNANDKIALYAGRLSREKGITYFVEAAKIILSKRNNVKFLILGDGPEKKNLENILKDNHLNDFIHLLGFKKNISRYYKAMDFLVLPSLTEGMPMVILEAFALNKPVIATHVGGIPEIVQNNINGLIVAPKDVSGLAQAMELLFSNPNLVSTMGENGHASVKTNHGFKIQSKKYLSVYKKTLQAKSLHFT